MPVLFKMPDGGAGLLFVRPDTRVLRITNATYQEAQQLLKGQVRDTDRDETAWGRTVARLDGADGVSLAR